jgi:heptosyltransferase-2/heptosyltransferase-3
MVLLTVLLRQLHSRFGQPVDLISTGPWTRALLKGQPVANLMVLQSRKTPFWFSRDQQRLVQWLRERGPGPTWFCDRDVGRDLLSRGGIHDDFICDLRALEQRPKESFADLYIRAANTSPRALAGAWPPPVAPVSRAAHLHVDLADYSALKGWQTRRGLIGRPFVIIHAGNRRATRGWLRGRRRNTKHWPEKHWAQVLRGVRDVLPGHAIILSGVSGEFGLNADIQALARIGDVHNVAGDLPIPILLPLLTRADSMIATDTGPAHAAAALGCPTVALFGNVDPYLYRPGGATTAAIAVTGYVGDHPNMFGIEPGTVMSAWLRVRTLGGYRQSGLPASSRNLSSQNTGEWPRHLRSVS